MKNSSKKSKTGSIIARVLITLLGAAFIMWGIGAFALGIAGEKGTAVITGNRREGGERNESIPGRYTYIVSYTFKLPNGESIDGFTRRIGNAVYVKADGASQIGIRYFKFFPYINALEEDAKFNWGQVILVLTGGFLIFIMNKQKRAKNKAP